MNKTANQSLDTRSSRRWWIGSMVVLVAVVDGLSPATGVFLRSDDIQTGITAVEPVVPLDPAGLDLRSVPSSSPDTVAADSMIDGPAVEIDRLLFPLELLSLGQGDLHRWVIDIALSWPLSRPDSLTDPFGEVWAWFDKNPLLAPSSTSDQQQQGASN